MKTLKEKGLDSAFATKEHREEEVKRLMTMTDQQFKDHVRVLELAKAAFSKPVETKASEEGEDEPEAPVSTETGINLKEAVAELSVLWEVADDTE
jgi:hypothetical protein